MSKQYGFSFNADRCLKCWACEIACRQWKGIPAGTVKLRKITEKTTGKFPNVKRQFLTETCRHCTDALCIAACPVEAITRQKKYGAVVVDREICTGCRACREACPYDIPQFDGGGKMWKCDMCLDRLEDGQQPICAATCPMQALGWVVAEKP